MTKFEKVWLCNGDRYHWIPQPLVLERESAPLYFGPRLWLLRPMGQTQVWAVMFSQNTWWWQRVRDSVDYWMERWSPTKNWTRGWPTWLFGAEPADS